MTTQNDNKTASKLIDIKSLEKAFPLKKLETLKQAKESPLFDSLVTLENSYGKVLQMVREFVASIDQTKQNKPCLSSAKKSLAQVLVIMDAYHLYRIAPHGSQVGRNSPNGILQNVKREVQSLYSDDSYTVTISKARGKGHVAEWVKIVAAPNGITAKAKGQQIVDVPTDTDTPSAKGRGIKESLSEVEQLASEDELEAQLTPVELSDTEKQALVLELVKKVGLKFAMDSLAQLAEGEAIAA